MSLEELEIERQQAVDSQKFELAAAIRDLIEEKKKSK
jgi:protein-arginine kinase activator protein McsA